MDARIKRNRIRRAVGASVLFAALSSMVALAIAGNVGNGGGQPPPDRGGQGIEPGLFPRRPRLEIGPIAGLTTAWHQAPESTGLPSGTDLALRIASSPGDQVNWVGALSLGCWNGYEWAHCPLMTPGAAMISVELESETLAVFNEMEIEVIDVAPGAIVMNNFQIIGGEVTLDVYSSPEILNPQTLALFFGVSIAALTKEPDGTWVTSVERPIPAIASIVPAELAPLIEWRVDGVAVALGRDAQPSMTDPGTFTLEAGPPGAPRIATVIAYRTTIVDASLLPPFVDHLPLKFIAETEPPGFEDRITWLASTKFGSTTSVLGTGDYFLTTFENTWGYMPDYEGDFFKWVGVKADQAALGGDAKSFACDFLPQLEDLQDQVTVDFHIVLNDCELGLDSEVIAAAQAVNSGAGQLVGLAELVRDALCGQFPPRSIPCVTAEAILTAASSLSSSSDELVAVVAGQMQCPDDDLLNALNDSIELIDLALESLAYLCSYKPECTATGDVKTLVYSRGNNECAQMKDQKVKSDPDGAGPLEGKYMYQTATVEIDAETKPDNCKCVEDKCDGTMKLTVEVRVKDLDIGVAQGKLPTLLGDLRLVEGTGPSAKTKDLGGAIPGPDLEVKIDTAKIDNDVKENEFKEGPVGTFKFSVTSSVPCKVGEFLKRFYILDKSRCAKEGVKPGEDYKPLTYIDVIVKNTEDEACVLVSQVTAYFIEFVPNYDFESTVEGVKQTPGASDELPKIDHKGNVVGSTRNIAKLIKEDGVGVVGEAAFPPKIPCFDDPAGEEGECPDAPWNYNGEGADE